MSLTSLLRKTCVFALLSLLVLAPGLPPASSTGFIPVTRVVGPDPAYRRATHPRLIEAAKIQPASLNLGMPVSVSVPNVLALPVEQQPADQPGFVSTRPDTVTQFKLAGDYGTIGLLAHNNLAGANFYKLKPNQTVILTYQDGSIRTFQIDQVKSYQALEPYNPYSNFVDLENPGSQLTSTQVFAQIYQRGSEVVFQTCIARDGNPSWGRMFVMATPIRQAAQLSPILPGASLTSSAQHSIGMTAN